MQRPSHNQPHHTYSKDSSDDIDATGMLKISEQSLETGSEIVHLLHRLAEDI
jgi:fatty acid desaturase